MMVRYIVHHHHMCEIPFNSHSSNTHHEHTQSHLHTTKHIQSVRQSQSESAQPRWFTVKWLSIISTFNKRTDLLLALRSVASTMPTTSYVNWDEYTPKSNYELMLRIWRPHRINNTMSMWCFSHLITTRYNGRLKIRSSTNSICL